MRCAHCGNVIPFAFADDGLSAPDFCSEACENAAYEEMHAQFTQHEADEQALDDAHALTMEMRDRWTPIDGEVWS